MFIRIEFERLEVAKHPILKEPNRMNTHKHARLTFARRLQMVLEMTEGGLTACEATAEHGVTPPTARKWLGRYLAGGTPALADASSRPIRSLRFIGPAKALLIVELRRRRMLQSRIARCVGVSESTVRRVLARAGLSRLSDLDPAAPVVRYEHEAPGELLHIDTKKLGRIVRPSHRLTGNRRDSSMVRVGRPCLWLSMNMRGWLLPRCIPMRRRSRPLASCATLWTTTSGWA